MIFIMIVFRPFVKRTEYL